MADALGVAAWWTVVSGSEAVRSSASCSERVKSDDSLHEIEAPRSGICDQ